MYSLIYCETYIICWTLLFFLIIPFATKLVPVLWLYKAGPVVIYLFFPDCGPLHANVQNQKVIEEPPNLIFGRELGISYPLFEIAVYQIFLFHAACGQRLHAAKDGMNA